MHLKKYVAIVFIAVSIWACKDDNSAEKVEEKELAEIVEEEKILEFGFNLNDYEVKRDTIRKGDTFGEIMGRHNIGYPQIFQIAERTKDSFDVTKVIPGKPFTLLYSKESVNDSLPSPETFIYQPNQEQYVVINLKDSIHAYTSRKPITYIEKTATGVENNIPRHHGNIPAASARQGTFSGDPMSHYKKNLTLLSKARFIVPNYPNLHCTVRKFCGPTPAAKL